MKRILLVLVLALALAALTAPVYAQGNYTPMDPATLPEVPGCSWYERPGYPGLYDAWCGSEAMGWYQPYEWYLLTGIYPPDYGMNGGFG